MLDLNGPQRFDMHHYDYSSNESVVWCLHALVQTRMINLVWVCDNLDKSKFSFSFTTSGHKPCSLLFHQTLIIQYHYRHKNYVSRYASSCSTCANPMKTHQHGCIIPWKHDKLKERPRWQNPAVHNRPGIPIFWHQRQWIPIKLYIVHSSENLSDSKPS